jgi:hypothetical protein
LTESGRIAGAAQIELEGIGLERGFCGILKGNPAIGGANEATAMADGEGMVWANAQLFNQFKIHRLTEIEQLELEETTLHRHGQAREKLFARTREPAGGGFGHKIGFFAG